MGMEADVETLKGQTIGQAYEALHRQAQTAKLRRETELLGVEEPEEEEQWTTLTDERGRIFRESSTTGRLEQVSGVPSAAPLTLEERVALKKIPTDIARGMYFENPSLPEGHPDKLAWVDKGEVPPPGYTKPLVSVEREISPIPEKRFDLVKDKAVRDSAVRIRMNLKNPAVMGEIEFINQNSESTFGFIWLETAKTFWPDAKETVEVKLPKDKDDKQLTMADIRRVAEANNISVEELLRRVYDSLPE